MYYSSGNYESFVHPRKPNDVDEKSAYIIGAGLAGLATTTYLVRDGQMKPENIHILELSKISGGACDGNKQVHGYFMRGGREMDNHFECMWDLYKDIPSYEEPDKTFWIITII